MLMQQGPRFDSGRKIFISSVTLLVEKRITTQAVCFLFFQNHSDGFFKKSFLVMKRSYFRVA